MLVKEGSGVNPLLGFTDTGQPVSTEHPDDGERSEKKVKRKAAEYTGESTMPVSYADIYDQGSDDIEKTPRVSYKQSLLGGEEDLPQGDNNSDMEADVDEDDGEFVGLSVVEKKIGQYDCP
ncbi:hypothetical protein QL285_040196 [Trifolium repens]|nr:hypothetical protein QL285_040196 [Trifolium repens]